MAGIFRSLTEGWRDQVARHRNRPFLEATMAACALVAAADGTVSFSERSKVDQVLENLERLRIFDVHAAVDLFNACLDELAEQPGEGEARLLDRVARMAADAEAADILVRICLAISHADGEFSPQEKKRVEEICGRLGLEASAFEL